MQAKDVMNTNVIRVKPSSSVSEVSELFLQHDFSGVPVVGDNNRVLGLISEKEMFATKHRIHIPTYLHLLKDTKFVIGSGKELPYVEQQVLTLKAKDILNPNTFLAQPDTALEKLVEISVYQGQDPILVTDMDKKLLGIVSRNDLLKLLLPAVSVNSENIAVTPRPIDRELDYVRKDLSSRFAYVSKARANIWLTVAITLMIVGFIAGIIYTADPTIFVSGD